MAQDESCPFMSAEQLGLNPEEYAALVKTLTLMEAGKFRHVPTNEVDERRTDSRYPFNMRMWKRQHPCGTVCCIGGSAELIGGLRYSAMETAALRLSNQGRRELYKLFWPVNSLPVWDNATPKQAAQALRNYLTTGKPQWEKTRA